MSSGTAWGPRENLQWLRSSKEILKLLTQTSKREEVSKGNTKNCKLCSRLLACQSHLQEDASRDGCDGV